LTALEAHPWSGNVRELRNVVESAVAMGSLTLEGAQVDGTGMSTRILHEGAGGQEELTLEMLDLPYREARAHSVAAFERTYLTRLTEACGGNASEAARRAHMDRPYLLSLLRKHGLR
jgi:DNA-binding NtrC family response regulator